MKLFLCMHFSSVESLIKEEIDNQKVVFIPTATLCEVYCCTRVEHSPKACNAQTIPKKKLQQAAIDAINEAVHCKDDTLSILQENVYAVIGQDNSDEIEEINRVIAEKQAELLKLVQGRKDYAKCADEMDELQKEKHLLLLKHAQLEGVKQRINELTELIQEQPLKLTEFDYKKVRKYIKQIEVFDDKFIVRFKAKFELELPRQQNVDQRQGLRSLLFFYAKFC